MVPLLSFELFKEEILNDGIHCPLHPASVRPASSANLPCTRVPAALSCPEVVAIPLRYMQVLL